eukprot:9552920-Prorocentrum_lima.AAC.2
MSRYARCFVQFASPHTLEMKQHIAMHISPSFFGALMAVSFRRGLPEVGSPLVAKRKPHQHHLPGLSRTTNKRAQTATTTSGHPFQNLLLWHVWFTVCFGTCVFRNLNACRSVVLI